MLLPWRHSDRTGMGVVKPRHGARRNRRAWWARFTFNGITRCEKGTPGSGAGRRRFRADMAAVIHGVIPGSEVRLYSCGEACGNGCRARGTAGPASDIDLLITAPDAWLEERNRFEVLNQLWGLLEQAVEEAHRRIFLASLSSRSSCCWRSGDAMNPNRV